MRSYCLRFGASVMQRIFNHKIIFVAFFVAFLLTSIVPLFIDENYTAEMMENELKSALNVEYYLITDQITRTLDQVYIRSWISELNNLSSILSYRRVYDPSIRNALIDGYFQQAGKIISLSLRTPDNPQPLHFLKKKQLSLLAEDDPVGVNAFFSFERISISSDESDESIFVQPPIILKNCNKIFLPIEASIEWDKGRKAWLRGIYTLTPVLNSISRDLAIGPREMYIVDQNAKIVFSNENGQFLQRTKLGFPIGNKIESSVGGINRVFQLEAFKYKGKFYVGNFSTTRFLNWAVVMVDRYHSAYALVDETRKKMDMWRIMAFFIAIVMSAVFSWFFSKIVVYFLHSEGWKLGRK